MSEPVDMGFLEESPGTKSMTRLSVLLMTVGAFLLVVSLCVVAVRGGTDAAGIIAALGVPLGALMGGIWGALKERER